MNLLYKLLPFGSILFGLLLLWDMQQLLLDNFQKIFYGMGVLFKEYLLHSPGIFFGILFIILPIFYLIFIKTKTSCLECGHKMKKNIFQCPSCNCLYTYSYNECNEDFSESIKRRCKLLKNVTKIAFIQVVVWAIWGTICAYVIATGVDFFYESPLRLFEWFSSSRLLHIFSLFAPMLLGFTHYGGPFGFSYWGWWYPLITLGVAIIYIVDKLNINFDSENTWGQCQRHPSSTWRYKLNNKTDQNEESFLDKEEKEKGVIITNIYKP